MMKLTTFLKSLPGVRPRLAGKQVKAGEILPAPLLADLYEMHAALGPVTLIGRSEEHTSELQSLMRISYAVFCLKKKKNLTSNNKTQTIHTSNVCTHQLS